MGKAVQDLQARLGVKVDGVFGAATAGALWAACNAGQVDAQDPEVLAARLDVCGQYEAPRPERPAPGSSILLDGRWVKPALDMIPLWVVPFHVHELKHSSRQQTVVQAILHHDGGASARACFQVLAARRLSSHFAVDDNGVVLQFLDPVTSTAWHAMGHAKLEDGTRVEAGFNFRSIGIDISNPVDPETGAGKADADRPVVTQRIHGHVMTRQGPYPCQVEAVLALLRELRRNIPSLGSSYRPEAEWRGDLNRNTPGIFGHYHVSAGKIDPFGFPMQRLAEV